MITFEVDIDTHIMGDFDGYKFPETEVPVFVNHYCDPTKLVGSALCSYDESSKKWKARIKNPVGSKYLIDSDLKPLAISGVIREGFLEVRSLSVIL